jgi:hypothetical protein
MQYYLKKYIKSKFKTTYKFFNPFQEKKVEVVSKEVKPKKNIYCDCFDRTEDANGNILCKNCGNIYTEVEDNINYNDYSRVNIVKRYHYEKKCHFHDTINQYQGKQNKYIPDSVYDDIKYMIRMHGLSLDKLTIAHVYLFLKETGNFKFYEDCFRILPHLFRVRESLRKRGVRQHNTRKNPYSAIPFSKVLNPK